MQKSKIILPALIFSAAVLLFGCNSNTMEDQIPMSGPDLDLQLSTVNEEGTVFSTETITPNRTKIPQNINSRKSPNLNVTGEFLTESGNFYDFSANMTPSGIHGEMSINHTILGMVESETICVYNIDNEAIIAVLFKSIEFPTGPFQENNIAFIKVVDNGEGINYDPDQHSSIILIYTDWFNLYETPEDFLIDFPCSDVFENVNFDTYVDVEEGQIQVR